MCSDIILKAKYKIYDMQKDVEFPALHLSQKATVHVNGCLLTIQSIKHIFHSSVNTGSS